VRKKRVTKGFRISSAYLLAGSIAIILVGVILFWIGTKGGQTNALLTGLASALVSLGSVTLVAEVLLRNAYTFDLLEIVGLEQSVYETGLSELSDEPSFDWSWVSDASPTAIRVALIDPRAWIQRDWPKVVDQAALRGIDIEVYLPAPGSEAVTTASAVLGIESSEYEAQIEAAVSQLRSSWRLRRSGFDPLDRRSFLTITRVPSVLSHGLVQCGDRLAFLFPGMHGAGGSSSPLVVAFDNRRGASIWHDQAARMWDHLAKGGWVPVWTDRKPSDDPNRPGLDLATQGDADDPDDLEVHDAD